MKIPELTWPYTDNADYDDDLLLDVTIGTVALLIRGRNAWHSTWVRHYLRNATLYTDVTSAKRGAEPQRERGNVFYVDEVPAVQLRGSVSNIVLCDAHPDSPFASFAGFGVGPQESSLGNWVGGLFPGVSVKDAAAAFLNVSGYWSGPTPDAHSLRTGRLDSGFTLSTGEGKLQSLVSEARGAKYPLGWNPRLSGSRYNRRGVNALRRKWEGLLETARAEELDDASRKQAFIYYRNIGLKAMPESVWRKLKIEREKELRAERDRPLNAWRAAYEISQRLEAQMTRAELELEAAEKDRMRPAETSEGIRLQRERLTAAAEEFERRKTEFCEAERIEEELYDLYLQRPVLGSDS